MIAEALRQALHTRRADEYQTHQRPAGTLPRLWVSEVGGCPRKALLRVLGYAAAPIPEATLAVMHGGIVWEQDTVAALQQVYGAGRVTSQLRLDAALWSGKIDCVLDHGTDHPILIEHKALSDRWWDYQRTLPTPSHAAQLALYGILYEQQFQVAPTLILFYRSWGHWAEFVVTRQEHQLVLSGAVDGVARTRTLPLDLARMQAVLEQHFMARSLPARLANPDDGCTRRGVPSCPFYHHCWPVAVDA